MKKLGLITFLCSLILLTSCSSVISTFRSTPLSENYGKRTWGGFIDDASIETKARVNLNKVDPTLDKSHLVVVSYNGIVLLAGQVPNPELKSLAGSTVKSVRKVRRVHNEIKIAGSSSTLARINDSWLTSKIKLRLFLTAGIPSSRVKVVCENGEIFLLGLLSRDEAQRVVAAVQKSYGIQKIVKMFEYTDDRPAY